MFYRNIQDICIYTYIYIRMREGGIKIANKKNVFLESFNYSGNKEKAK